MPETRVDLTTPWPDDDPSEWVDLPTEWPHPGFDRDDKYGLCPACDAWHHYAAPRREEAPRDHAGKLVPGWWRDIHEVFAAKYPARFESSRLHRNAVRHARRRAKAGA